MNPVLIFFIAGFVFSVVGMLMYLKADDTTFKKTVSQMSEIQVEASNNYNKSQEALNRLTDELGKLQAEWLVELTRLKHANEQLRNKVEAIDLEVERLKEKTTARKPTPANVSLTVTKPIPVEIIEKPKLSVKPMSNSLLERSGVKKPARQKRH